jgi:hypothetical protein
MTTVDVSAEPAVLHRTPHRPRSDRLVTVGLAVIAIGFSIWAAVGAAWLEPHLSSNADEYAYLAQARLLGDGRLAASAPDGAIAESFRPWFGIETDHGYVFKYNPVWPAVLAVPVLLGIRELGPAIAAATFTLGTFFLAASIVSRRRALLATALTVLAPIALIDGTSYLQYVFFGGLWTFAAGMLVRGVRNRARAHLAGAGALASLAFCARPYDAVLLLAPFAAWALWELRHDLGALVTNARAVAFGAAPFVVLQGIYNWVVVGNPTSFAFSKWSSADKLGFGPRGLDPSAVPDLDFTLRHGVKGALAHLWALRTWSFGGFALLAAAALGLWVLHRKTSALALAASSAALGAGYVLFWGTYGVAEFGEFFDRFGPFYFVPVIVPLGVFAAEGLAWLWARRHGLSRSAAVVLSVAMLTTSGIGLRDAIDVALATRDSTNVTYDLVAERFDDPARRSLVLLPETFVGLMMPDLYSYDVSASTPVLYAATLGDADVDLVDAYPGRRAYRLLGCNYSQMGELGARPVPRRSEKRFRIVDGNGARIQPLQLISSDSLDLRITVPAPEVARGAELTVDVGEIRYAAGIQAAADGPTVVHVVIASDGVRLAGAVGPTTIGPSPGTGSKSLEILVRRARPDGRLPTRSSPDLLWSAPLRTSPGTVTMLGPVLVKTLTYHRVAGFARVTTHCAPLDDAQLTVD